MSESNVQKEIMLALSKAGATTWRNNTAQAWVGEATRLRNGDVLLRNARRLHAGLCVGSSDLIGLTPVTVEPKHVGSTFGLFTAVEVKNPVRGRATTQQVNFIDHVRSNGGLAGIARSVEDALKIIGQHDNSP